MLNISKLNNSKDLVIGVSYIKRTVLSQIITIDLSDKINNTILAEKIYTYQKTHPKSEYHTNLSCWRSEYNLHKLTDVFNTEISILNSVINRVLETNACNYKICELWAAIYKTGDSANVHTHKLYPYAGVYYVEAERDCAPLVFELEKLTINPKPHMLILFPGDILHHVPVIQRESKRTILSFNIINTYKGSI